jgi:5-methylcytosine-specific restriction protein A
LISASASLDEPELNIDGMDSEDNDIVDAEEGRLLTRIHLLRERSRSLVEAKRRRSMATLGKLECEVCGFDFALHYGEHGLGFIECHHLRPVMTLAVGQPSGPALKISLLCAPTAIE